MKKAHRSLCVIFLESIKFRTPTAVVNCALFLCMKPTVEEGSF
jgi:hypothetical protein